MPLNPTNKLMKPKINDIVRFKKPNPDEDAGQLYVLLDDPEVQRDGDRCHVDIRAIGTGLVIAPINSVDCEDLERVPDYQGMSVAQGAEHAIRTLRGFSRKWQDWIAYAASHERGQYRGFAALHDKCDANMLLPFAEDCLTTDEEAAFHNAVMTVVSELIIRNECRPVCSVS